MAQVALSLRSRGPCATSALSKAELSDTVRSSACRARAEAFHSPRSTASCSDLGSLASDDESTQPSLRSQPTSRSLSSVASEVACSSPGSARDGGATSDSDFCDEQPQKTAATDKVLRAARSILNKLTVEKFDALYEQLAQSGIATVQHIQLLVQEILEKATAQHHFIPMYADLCVRLETDQRLVPASLYQAQSTSFKTCLLNRCQEVFERLLVCGSAAGACDEEAKLVRKQRALGNVKFVGHLIIRGMLSPRLLLQCSTDLIAAREQCPEALESAAALLTVAAPPCDTAAWSLKGQLDAVFEQLTALSKDKAVAARERFLLRDLLDARAAAWPARACAAKPSAPMRLEEVRAAAVADAAPRDRAASERWGRPAEATRRRRCATEAAPRAAQPRPAAKVAAKAAPVEVAASPAPSTPSTPSTRPSTPPTPPAPPAQPEGPFDAKAFRKVLTTTMKELAQGGSVPAAVQRIRTQGVPVKRQAAEFSDILTRACEESRGPIRRSAFAFAAGLCAAAGGHSAFERSACLQGLEVFFGDVFEGLEEELPRLPWIVESEMLPTLGSVLSPAELRAAAPQRFWQA